MKTYRSYGNYVTKPVTLVKSKLEAYVGWNGISQVIDENIVKGKRVFVMDLYPGVEESQVKEKIERMYENAEVIGVSEALYSYEKLDDINIAITMYASDSDGFSSIVFSINIRNKDQWK